MLITIYWLFCVEIYERTNGNEKSQNLYAIQWRRRNDKAKIFMCVVAVFFSLFFSNVTKRITK